MCEMRKKLTLAKFISPILEPRRFDEILVKSDGRHDRR
jgi:hypothetical protein